MSCQTFTGWKRLLTPGCTLVVDNHRRPKASRTCEVMKVQTNKICTTSDEAGASGSWLYWPPAAEVRIVDEHTVEFLAAEWTPAHEPSGLEAIAEGAAWITLHVPQTPPQAPPQVQP